MSIRAHIRPAEARTRRPRGHAALRLAALLMLCPFSGHATHAAPAPGGARAVASATARDEGLIRAALARHVQRYNARDAEAMRGEYTEDAVVMSSYLGTVEGRDRVNDLYREEFAASKTADATSLMEASLDEVQVLGDWAFDRGTITITTSQGGFERKTAIRFMEIRRRGPDGAWQVTRSMDNLVARPFGSARGR